METKGTFHGNRRPLRYITVRPQTGNRRVRTAASRRDRAEALAEALAATDLVTRDYLDAKLREQDLRLDTKLADLKTGMADLKAEMMK